LPDKTDFSLYDVLPIPISVVDVDGRLQYYNSAAAALFDRKPEYIGQDIRSCHQKSSSRAKIDDLLVYIKDPDKSAASYRVERNGKSYRIVISRLVVAGKLEGFVQSVLQEHIEPTP
jgi:DUF438 domain-containing protein